MIKLLAAIVAASALLTASAHAGVQKAPKNSHQMVKLCLKENDEIAEATCQGFVSGVVETTRNYVTANVLEPPFCVPGEVALSETLAIYRSYLEQNRALKHFPAAILAVSAFKEAYPCGDAT